jgi:hypothetical protein
MSHTNFDGHKFASTAGLAAFDGLSALAAGAHARAQANADAAATSAALASWANLVAGLEIDVAYLRGVNSELAAALRERDDELLLLRAELATAQVRIEGAGL